MVVVRDISTLLPEISAEQAINIVLPIIVQLSKDPEDAVKELLAGELDKIMYYYYTVRYFLLRNDVQRKGGREP